VHKAFSFARMLRDARRRGRRAWAAARGAVRPRRGRRDGRARGPGARASRGARQRALRVLTRPRRRCAASLIPSVVVGTGASASAGESVRSRAPGRGTCIRRTGRSRDRCTCCTYGTARRGCSQRPPSSTWGGKTSPRRSTWRKADLLRRIRHLERRLHGGLRGRAPQHGHQGGSAARRAGADNKWFTRVVVCAPVIETLAGLDLAYPRGDKAKGGAGGGAPDAAHGVSVRPGGGELRVSNLPRGLRGRRRRPHRWSDGRSRRRNARAVRSASACP
jgi:hypothetical protein